MSSPLLWLGAEEWGHPARSPSPVVLVYIRHLVSISQLISGDQALMSAEGWGLGFPLARRQGGSREEKMETWTDSSVRIRWGNLRRAGQASHQGPEFPATATASTPSRKRLLVPTPLPSGPDSATKLLQECYEACRTWGASWPPFRGGDGCVVNDPETFPARETPPAFQTPMAMSPLT